MRVVVVGAGPVGVVCAYALAEQGASVVLVDADPGPSGDEPWRRRGVMQFSHPHFFRHKVRAVLEEVAPALWQALLRAGGVLNPALDGMPPDMTTLACRRSTFETALRGAATSERLERLTGYAERVLVERDRVTGVVVDGRAVEADLVVAATGRTDRFADDLRPPAEGGACGLSYVSRMYRARPGVEPLVNWQPPGAQYDGYQAIAFPQDAGTLSALVVRPSADPALEGMWETGRFDAAVAAIPLLAPWTDPERFEPITPPMRGGTLTNTYRGQGRPPAGLLFVGDAVCTTNPSAGRGVTLGLQQVATLIALLAEHPDPRDVSAALDAWCNTHIRPWYQDHVDTDRYLVRRYAGQPLDVDGPLPGDVYPDAMEQLPHITPVVQQYLAMNAGPDSLLAVADEVRALLRTGWRPEPSAGPSAAELAALMEPAAAR